jgi:hypothetical protein
VSWDRPAKIEEAFFRHAIFQSFTRSAMRGIRGGGLLHGGLRLGPPIGSDL